MDFQVVTGAFGFSGKYIASRLLAASVPVHTLTNSPNRANPFEGKISASPYNFDEPEKLIRSLRGASVLYNTYWVRFNHRDFTHRTAVENTLKLFEAAKAAGVRRIVHISITNPSEDSELEYFRGKARLEKELRNTGLSYSILRPAVLFGKEDILVNNLSWALRRLPAFGLFGDGTYRLQPIYVDDLAALAIEQGASDENRIIDAIGPETFTYRGLVEMLQDAIGAHRPVVPVHPEIAYLAGSLIGRLVGDTFITREEIAGLMQNLLCTDSTPAGATPLSLWASQNAGSLGRKYASELGRRRDTQSAYENI
ncbi:MAG TPA: NAD(P)H-binding protein [Anaerolineales bacterium]|nr:NAD(P)H-binding protein [Anaerolineales bacterium]